LEQSFASRGGSRRTAARSPHRQIHFLGIAQQWKYSNGREGSPQLENPKSQISNLKFQSQIAEFKLTGLFAKMDASSPIFPWPKPNQIGETWYNVPGQSALVGMAPHELRRLPVSRKSEGRFHAHYGGAKSPVVH
jgi:hypothetical protein